MVRRMVVNLALLVGIVFPIWLLTVGVLAYFSAGLQGMRDWFSSGLYFLFLMAPRLLIAGMGQQILLLFLPPTWPPAWRRVLAVFSTVVVYPWAALVGEAVGLIPGLIVYGLVLRLPRAPQPDDFSS
jgi:hypothetical protein